MESQQRSPLTVDIGDVLDQGAWSNLQKAVFCLAALAVLFDGFDSQLISFAIPMLIKQWHVTREIFAPVVAAGLVGMAVGSFCSGEIGDRLGRRTTVIGCLILLGVSNFAIGFANGLVTVGILRFLAGLGIGGALPLATTTTAEFTPARYRAMAVTATITCVPLGGMVAGLFAGAILPALGWRALFWLGGPLPVVLAVVLLFALPESPRFMTRHRGRWPDLVNLLGRMGRPTAAGAAFTDLAEQRIEHGSGVSALFAQGWIRDTLCLWGACFLCLLSVYSAFSWLPTMLSAQGLKVAAAASGLTAYNLGGVFGSLLCAAAISRLGSRWPQIVCAIGAAASAFILAKVGVADSATMTLWFGLHGLFVNAVQSTLYAVAAYTYPTRVRATGTATALAFGRLGAVLSAFVGAAVISSAGPNSYLGVLGGSMLGVAMFLFFLRRHIPARSVPVELVAPVAEEARP